MSYRLVVVLLALMAVLSVVAAEPLKLTVVSLDENTAGLGRDLSQTQKGDSNLKIFAATEADLIARYTDYDKLDSMAAYSVSAAPGIYVLHGFSGSGADDLRSFHVSGAFADEAAGLITIAMKMEKITSMFGRIGTCDVQYLNYVVSLEGLAPGTYKVNAVLHTTHRNEGPGKGGSGGLVTGNEKSEVKTFTLKLE